MDTLPPLQPLRWQLTMHPAVWCAYPIPNLAIRVRCVVGAFLTDHGTSHDTLQAAQLASEAHFAGQLASLFVASPQPHGPGRFAITARKPSATPTERTAA